MISSQFVCMEYKKKKKTRLNDIKKKLQEIEVNK